MRGLFWPDKGRYADIAREMQDSGDFVTPAPRFAVVLPLVRPQRLLHGFCARTRGIAA